MKLFLASLLSVLTSVLAGAAEPLQIAVIPKSAGNEYWNAVKIGAEKAAAELTAAGTPVIVHWDGTEREDQIDEQNKIIARHVARRVDAIVLAPMHAQALVPAAEEVVAAKIPLTIIDSPLNSEVARSTVATNNYKAGLLAGRRMAEAINGAGKVALLRYMKGHSSTLPRESGFLDAMKKYPGIQVVSADVFGGVSLAENQAQAQQLLARFGSDLQGVFASNLTASEGMLAALRAAGGAGKIAFVAFDSSEALIAALRKGEVAGIAVQQPVTMGYLGVKTAVSIIQGKSVPKEVDTDVKIVTPENIGTPEVAKLLAP